MSCVYYALSTLCLLQHDGGQVSCEYCGKLYSTRSSLHGHKRKKHPIKLKRELRRKVQQRLRSVTSAQSSSNSKSIAGIIDDYRYRSSLYNAVSRAVESMRKDKMERKLANGESQDGDGSLSREEPDVNDDTNKPMMTRRRRVSNKAGYMMNLGLDNAQEGKQKRRSRAASKKNDSKSNTSQSPPNFTQDLNVSAASEVSAIKESPSKSRRQRSIAQIASNLHARFVSRDMTTPPLFQPLPKPDDDVTAAEPLDLSVKSAIPMLKNSFGSSDSHRLEQIREIPYYAH